MNNKNEENKLAGFLEVILQMKGEVICDELLDYIEEVVDYCIKKKYL